MMMEAFRGRIGWILFGRTRGFMLLHTSRRLVNILATFFYFSNQRLPLFVGQPYSLQR